MHSSRMRTVHCSGRLGGCLLREGGVCPGRVVFAQRGVCLGGCLPRGCLPGGVCPDPLPVNEITDRCKNISATTVADGKYGISANLAAL